MKQKICLFWCCIVFVAFGAKAQPINEDLPIVTNAVALINARVITAPGKEPVISTILVRDGLITQIGPDIPIPADAYSIKADSFYVYTAFIEVFSSKVLKEYE